MESLDQISIGSIQNLYLGMLSGKDILLVAPYYHGYQNFLRKTLENLNASVVLIDNKAFKYDPLNKGTQWFEAWFCKKNRYIRKQIMPYTNRPFDACLFVNLFSFHPTIVENLRKANPSIKCILYIWDNIEGYKWKSFLRYFDDIYMFDPIEAKEHGIKYLPNFHLDIPIPGTENNKFDLHFVGSLQVHRMTMLERITAMCQERKKRFFFYLHVPPVYSKFRNNTLMYAFSNLFPNRFTGYKRLYKIQKGIAEHALIHYSPMKLAETMQTMAQSHGVIDLPYPSQTGSTHRVVQALALGKKVLTTNQSVVHDSFYHPDWIKVISESGDDIDWDWIYSDHHSHKPDMETLRIDNWLLQVFVSIR
jgi:hypothetical protein